MNPRFGRRQWVKLWVNEWLEGTTRYEMSDAQRAFWIDLLSMAGRSRFPGVVCAGEVEGKLIGYPLSKYQSLPSGPLDVEATLSLFVQREKITLEVNHDGPVPLYLIRIINWHRFQSEYQRTKNTQKRYRERRSGQSITETIAQTITASNTDAIPENIRTEVEERRKTLDFGSKNEPKSHASSTSLHDTNDPSRRVERDIIARVFDHYLARTGKNPKVNKLTPLRRNKGKARLEEALEMAGKDYVRAEGLLILAVDAFTSSDWHMGRDPKTNGKKYDSWEKHLFPNREKFEYWIQQPERVEATA